MTKSSKIIPIVLPLILVLILGFYVLRYVNIKNPESQHTLSDIKTLIIKQKDCITALSQLSQFTKNNPQNAEAYSWQGVCQYQTGDWTAAKVSFEKALALDPKLEAPENYLKHMSSGAQPSKPFPEFQADLEAKLGFTPDPSVIKFERFIIRQASATSTKEFSVALYNGQKSVVQIESYLNDTLKKIPSLTFSMQKSKTNAIFFVSVVSEKKNYQISVENTKPVKVTFTYLSQ